MKNLRIPTKQLLAIGFTKKVSKGDKLNKPRTYYEIPSMNGAFYYNPKEATHVWYHRTTVGEHSNHVNLSIPSAPVLFTVLQAFGVKFNLVIL